MKNKTNEIDVKSYFWNSLRIFDTINTLCSGLENKLESMIEEHPKAIIDIKTIANIIDLIKVESEGALELLTERKQELAEQE